MLLLLAMSRLPFVNADVQTAGGGGPPSSKRQEAGGRGAEPTHRQSFVRLYVPGNSYLRAALSKFVAIMRGMPRHYDRATHTMVRYVFTSHGDYYLNAKQLGRLGAEVPIVLEHGADGERVFFEVVFEFVSGDEACPPNADPNLPLHAISMMMNESQRVGITRQRVAPMSAAFIRSIAILDAWRLTPQELERCTTEFLSRLSESIAPAGGRGRGAGRGGLIIHQRTPRAQMRMRNAQPMWEVARLQYVAYEAEYLAPLERRLGVGTTSPGQLRFGSVPASWDVDVLDSRGHTQCLVVGHYPEPATGFNVRLAGRTTCDDRASAQSWWLFSLAALLRES